MSRLQLQFLDGKTQLADYYTNRPSALPANSITVEPVS